MSKAWTILCGESTHIEAGWVVSDLFLRAMNVRKHWKHLTSIATHATSARRRFRSQPEYVMLSLTCHVLTNDHCSLRPSLAPPCRCRSLALCLPTCYFCPNAAKL